MSANIFFRVVYGLCSVGDFPPTTPVFQYKTQKEITHNIPEVYDNYSLKGGWKITILENSLISSEIQKENSNRKV